MAVEVPNPNQGHEWKLVGNSVQANIYSKACTGDGVIRTHRYHPGVRCSECQDLWEVKNDKLKKMIRRRGELLIGVIQILKHTGTGDQ